MLPPTVETIGLRTTICMISVKKRDGNIVPFNIDKIYNAIKKAMNMSGKISETVAHKIGEEIYTKHVNENMPINISEIETDVFNLLIKHGKKEVAKLYEGYRSIREFQRKSSNDIESQVSELLDGKSDYWNNENSNKNQHLVTTQRDYMAGIVSTNISRKYLLPPDIIQAHDEGILHFHDIDYFGDNARSNCCLINLDDMLQNGTVVNGVTIDKPHRLITATTIATQIIVAVTSAQYGLNSAV